MNIGWNYRREHLPLEHRSHYVVTNGGDQPNVVPRHRFGLVLLPPDDLPEDQGALEDRRRHGQGRGADDGHRAPADARARHRLAAALQQDRRRDRPGPTSRRSACRHGARPIRRWRRRCRRSSARARQGSGAERSRRSCKGPVTDNRGGGSDDIGDISWNVPTVTLRYPANIPGLPGHNWANAIAMATPIAHKGATAGAKVQAMTILDLLLQPGARDPGLGLLPHRADQGSEVPAAAPARRQAGDRVEQGR